MNFKIVTAVITAIIMICGSGVSYAKTPQEVTEIKRLAAGGNAEAQHELGVSYWVGRYGLPEDREKAYRWIRKAAEQGYANAQHWLGWIYEGGDGFFPQNNSKAFEWYKKAAEQGQIYAQKKLDSLRDSRKDVQKNDKKTSTAGADAAAKSCDIEPPKCSSIGKKYQEWGNNNRITEPFASNACSAKGLMKVLETCIKAYHSEGRARCDKELRLSEQLVITKQEYYDSARGYSSLHGKNLEIPTACPGLSQIK